MAPAGATLGVDKRTGSVRFQTTDDVSGAAGRWTGAEHRHERLDRLAQRTHLSPALLKEAALVRQGHDLVAPGPRTEVGAEFLMGCAEARRGREGAEPAQVLLSDMVDNSHRSVLRVKGPSPRCPGAILDLCEMLPGPNIGQWRAQGTCLVALIDRFELSTISDRSTGGPESGYPRTSATASK
jgi:hypothetical protein